MDSTNGDICYRKYNISYEKFLKQLLYMHITSVVEEVNNKNNVHTSISLIADEKINNTADFQ